MDKFAFESLPGRVVFGPGSLGRTAEEVERLGRSRVLLLSSSSSTEAADRIGDLLGAALVARFTGARMHTPVPTTVKALDLVGEHDVDCVIAVGGGSVIGLGKALAVRTGVDQVVLPTTFAGSEVTPVLGETENGVKTTRSSLDILPETVLYDVELVRGMPVPLMVTSAVNALAHAVEALYSPDANPVTDEAALDAIRRIARGLRAVSIDRLDDDIRADLLHAAWRAGTCLGAVRMGLHHKLCHTLGGSADLPHAPAHCVVLPHAMAFNAAAAPEAMRRIAEALSVNDAPRGVFELIAAAGGPTSLHELGLEEADIDRLVGIAAATPYPNPARIRTDSLTRLLRSAWAGERPVAGIDSENADELDTITSSVVASFADTPDARLRELLMGLVPRLHEFARTFDLTQDEWQSGIDFLTDTGKICSDVRQEFVLLSDTLGVSSIVDLLENSRNPEATPSAVLGPFYVEGPPELGQGSDIAHGAPGTPLWVDVRVTDTDGNPLVGSVVDVWQSDDNGFYDVQLPDLEGPVLRGRLRTDDEGRVKFWSILPCEYPIPADGPVGAMLTATKRHPYRAPHLHFMIAAPGRRTLVTQLFVQGGAYLDSDAVFGVKEALIVDFTPHSGPADGRVVEGEWRKLTFDFRIAGTNLCL